MVNKVNAIRISFSRREFEEYHPDLQLNAYLKQIEGRVLSIQQTRQEFVAKGHPETYTVLVEYLIAVEIETL